jgi:hypothetical protein
MTKPLDPESINELASRDGVDRLAVESFLSTCHSLDPFLAYTKLTSYAEVRGWNVSTSVAILEGLTLVFGTRL